VARTAFDLDYARLWERGVRVLLFDLDNTLGRHGAQSLGDDALALLRRLTAQGFKVAILTNRKGGRTAALTAALAGEFPVLGVARKPHRAGFARILAEVGDTAARAAMIGDRRLTDVLGANRSGIYSIRVKGFRR